MNKVKIGALLTGLLLWGGLSAQAQIGEHRNDFPSDSTVAMCSAL